MRFESMNSAACVEAKDRLKREVMRRCKSGLGSPYWLTVREAAGLCCVPQVDVELIAADTVADDDGWVDMVGPVWGKTGDLQLEWVSR